MWSECYWFGVGAICFVFVFFRTLWWPGWFDLLFFAKVFCSREEVSYAENPLFTGVVLLVGGGFGANFAFFRGVLMRLVYCGTSLG